MGSTSRRLFTKQSVAGVAGLASGLPSSQLAHLDLRDCGITADGLHDLAEAVASSRSLQVLRLDENSLNTEGAAALAQALSKESALEELHISNTSVGDEGRLWWHHLNPIQFCEAEAICKAKLRLRG